MNPPSTPAAPSPFGGLADGPMPDADRDWIKKETDARCGQRSMRGPAHAPTEKQIAEAAALAIDLYVAAAAMASTAPVWPSLATARLQLLESLRDAGVPYGDGKHVSREDGRSQ